jgi:hypothetical protein
VGQNQIAALGMAAAGAATSEKGNGNYNQNGKSGFHNG